MYFYTRSYRNHTCSCSIVVSNNVPACRQNSTCRRIARRNVKRTKNAGNRNQLCRVTLLLKWERNREKRNEYERATDGSRAGAGDNLIGRRLQSSLMTRSARPGYCVARLPFLSTCLLACPPYLLFSSRILAICIYFFVYSYDSICSWHFINIHFYKLRYK